MLQEQDRIKLDGIVQKMIQNQETDTNIQAVVNDFKSKYSNKVTPTKPVAVMATNPEAVNEPTFKYNPTDSAPMKLATALGNAPQSIFNIGKGIVSAVANPYDTVKNLGDLIGGTVATGGRKLLNDTSFGQKILGGANEVRKMAEIPEMERDQAGNFIAPGTAQTDMAENVGGYFKERYGGGENIAKTFVEDPAGLFLDASMVLSGGSTASAKLAGLSKTAGLAKTANFLTKTAEVTGKVSSAIDPIQQIVKRGAPIVVNKAKGLNELITKSGKELQADAVATGIESMNQGLKGLKNKFYDTSFKLKMPDGNVKEITPIETMREYKLIPEVREGKVNIDKIKAGKTDAMNLLDTKIDEVLGSVEGNVRLDDFSAEIARQIKKDEYLKDSGKVGATLQKLEKFIEDLKTSYGDEVDMDRINKIRKTANKDFKEDSIDLSRKVGDAGREYIYNATPDQVVKSYLLEQRKLVNAEKFALKLENYAVKGGRLGGMFWTTLGALLGKGMDIAPIVGPVAGAVGGRALAELIQRRQFKSIPADIKAGLEKIIGTELKADTTVIPERINAGIQKLFGNKKEPVLPGQVMNTESKLDQMSPNISDTNITANKTSNIPESVSQAVPMSKEQAFAQGRLVNKMEPEVNILDEAKKLTKEEFLAKYSAEPSTDFIKNASKEEFDSAKYYDKAHGRVEIKNIDPSEHDTFEDVAKMGKDSKEYIDEMARLLKENPDMDLTPVLLDGTVTDPKLRPAVVDGHHRVSAYIQAGRKDIPYQYSRNTLEEVYKGAEKLPKNTNPIFNENKNVPEFKDNIFTEDGYDTKKFDDYIDSIKGDYIPMTHETTREIAEKILKGETIGEGEPIFASLGFRESADFVTGENAVRILLKVPKEYLRASPELRKLIGSKYTLSLDTMDHSPDFPFKGIGGHVAYDPKNSHIVEVLDINGNSIMKNNGLKKLIGSGGIKK